MTNIKDEIIILGEKEFSKNKQELENFAKYIFRASEEKKDGKYKNWWLRKPDGKVKNAIVFYELFKQVANEGLWLDGVHITIQSTGLSYDYVAYKNKMLVVYPETTIDLQLVYKGDEVEFSKENGKVNYSHKLKNPFTKKDDDIIGGYVVIKNKRGEFLVTQTREDFEIAKKIAPQDFIWKKFYAQMCLKTLIKRGCKVHFSDIYEKIELEDNKQNTFEKLEQEYTEQQEEKKRKKQEELKQKYSNL